jgi:phosphate transport system permease protein
MNSPATPVTIAVKRAPTDWKGDAMTRRIAGRYAAERRFKLLGLAAVVLSAAFLAFLLITMASSGARGFMKTSVSVPVDFSKLDLFIDPATLKGPDASTILSNSGLDTAMSSAATQAFGPQGPELIAETSWIFLRDAILADPSILQKKITLDVPASSELDLASRGADKSAMAAAYSKLDRGGMISHGFNTQFLTDSDATDPTQVGIWGAFKGSLLTMLVTLALAFPVGVMSAVYLEEYAPKNRWTDMIEVSINNLAAVPSIIFGLLGLAVFLNSFGLPRSAPLVGGLTLALMTMPVIVIAGRNAIKSVPPSIRDAALGIGASRVQVVFHHVLPLALPGILTGTIIGMARALGETAPLLMIGMRAFITTPPEGITSPSSVLPVQIYLWSDEVSRGFVEKTSAAIIVLLVFLLSMNGIAIYLRNKFEQRW